MFLGAMASAGAGGLMFLNSDRFGALPHAAQPLREINAPSASGGETR